MTLAEKIFQKIQKWPNDLQSEVLDFVDFIDLRRGHVRDQEWRDFSLASAMRGMEEEISPQYTSQDIKEKFE